MKKFKIVSSFKKSPAQANAVKEICKSFKENKKFQVLLGVTGSGKTFTMAHVIENLQEPALILAPNKTLAAQLFSEFKDIFPENSVEYFVSYYDYYQPEAYVFATDTYIEKDSSINEQIDRMRHSATRALLERKDVIIISSVSCIYGLGSPEAYQELLYFVKVNTSIKREDFLKKLIAIQYQRNDIDFFRGNFRVRGDSVEVFPPYEQNRSYRFEFFGDYIDAISEVDFLTGKTLKTLDSVNLYPATHYVSSEQQNKIAIQAIKEDLKLHLQHLKKENKHLEYERLKRRTLYDIEMIEELGTCKGVENYSRYFTGKVSGEAPPTLIDYFPKNFLIFVDESHISLPQVGGMYRGDRSRKETLVLHGFRLPSALDNRPLNFEEFEQKLDKVLCVSATPGDYELQKSLGAVTEQIIRPTGLLDPEIEIHSAKHQVDHLLSQIKLRVQKKERVMVTVLTKKMAEKLSSYYQDIGIKVKYLHSDIKTVERTEIIKDLRLGTFDVLVGINLLREGLDIPEVSLVAILDADKEGFLRSEKSLIQTIGRAARNINGTVILYADKQTNSIKKAIEESSRRRKLQEDYNRAHGITPKSIFKKESKSLSDIYGLSSDEDMKLLSSSQNKGEKSFQKEISALKQEMKKAAKDLDFERAVLLRDKIRKLEILELEKLS